uniref:Uncharacterized protein n=1 Tax=Leersia perrieri TaxID=77586 RepID=A0A0D9X6F6_9ORYZ
MLIIASVGSHRHLIVGFFRHPNIELWERKADSDGVTKWVTWITVELVDVLSLRSTMESLDIYKAVLLMDISGYDEESNVIHLWTNFGIFMIQLSEAGPNIINTTAM